MKIFLLVLSAICTLVTPVLAARSVYLKEGGTISAKSVWRTKGTVHVLVNRDTLTEFPTAEIDMKRTFARKHRAARKQTPDSGVSRRAESAPVGAVMNQKDVSAKAGMQFPALPKLTEKNPESLVPKNEEGAIRKHKKEMAERVGE